MSRPRLAARLDVKGSNLIKGIHLEGLRVVGDPEQFAQHYYEDGVDEIIYMDCVASLYGRNNLMDVVNSTSTKVFVPLTVGGGLRSCEDIREVLRAGADKVTINTAATQRPELITEVAERFGAQCMVLGIEAKRRRDGGWDAFVDNGREPAGLDVIEWAKQAVSLGAGEILLTSVDQEGTMKGFDLELVKAVSAVVSVPVAASGGAGSVQDCLDAYASGADVVAVASIAHFGKVKFQEIRAAAVQAGIPLRSIWDAKIDA
jgi:imidazole glycerol-phosphate synthase subunit HisF